MWVWLVVALVVVPTLALHTIFWVALGARGTTATSAAGATSTSAPTPTASQARPTPTPTPPTTPDAALNPHARPSEIPKGRLVVARSCVQRTTAKTKAKVPKSSPFGPINAGPGASLRRMYDTRSSTLKSADGVTGVRACDRSLWKVVRTVLPDDDLRMIHEFMAFEADTSRSTFISGVVAPSYTRQTFRLSLSVNGIVDRREIAFLVAHEGAHVLSLNNRQVAQSAGEPSCEREVTPYVCARRPSLLDSWVGATWSKKLTKEYNAKVTKAKPKKRQAAIEAFYDRHRSSFVTEYAATSPTEDFAESFAMWCSLTPDDSFRRASTSGKAGAAKKVSWFGNSKVITKVYGPRCAKLRTIRIS